jgi:hypothetical protein
MGRYNKFEQQGKPKKEQNPIWRGIGCILIVITPMITYGLTLILIPVLLKTGMVPQEILKNLHFPAWVSKVIILKDIAAFLSGIDNLWLGMLVFLIILILLTGIVSMIYTAILQTIGPPRYGPTDAPPSKFKARKYTR